MTERQLKIGGMHCVDCAHTVERALAAVPGVARARVHYLKKVATVTVDDSVPTATLVEAVARVGYQAAPAE
ncbi:MAG: heavy-metal-associated domain-containing protein [Actinomycetia bacterium]|jgi:copper chaperone CopZ|nr:heavy-metal-associated domain-containing protein [Actinomycetes bacterium]